MKKHFLLFILISLFAFSSCEKENPKVEIITYKGTIVVELDLENAPITAGNFLELVKQGVFDGGSFYRSVRNSSTQEQPIRISIVQGGIAHKPNAPGVDPIPHETTEDTGIKHKYLTVSMARAEPGTASSEFFICMADEPELDFGGKRNPDGQGFAAFGQVVAGEDIVHKVWGSPAMGEKIDPVVMIHRIKVKD
jgi:peptidyl-prolyl cis-trans isomerase A (cyclophilin A)